MRPDWLHEIKHDCFRVMARTEGKRVKLYSRLGNDLTYRFPLIVEALAKLRSPSCIIVAKQSRVVMTGFNEYSEHEDGPVVWSCSRTPASSGCDGFQCGRK